MVTGASFTGATSIWIVCGTVTVPSLMVAVRFKLPLKFRFGVKLQVPSLLLTKVPLGAEMLAKL